MAAPESPLQWGRRVNTAECAVYDAAAVLVFALQWGRRVNTAECGGSAQAECSQD